MGLFDVYQRLPAPLRGGAKNMFAALPLRWRVPRRFFELAAFLEQSQWWSPDRLAGWQNDQLRRLIAHAYEQVPYYRRVMDELGLKPGDIQSQADLPKLPPLTKDLVRAHKDDLRARNFSDEQLATFNTSGTTGKPLFFYYEKAKDYLYNDPYIWRYFNWGGHTLGQRRATISAWTLPEGIYTQYNPVRRLLLLSAYRLNRASAPHYATALAQQRIPFLDGYPTSLELLTRLLMEHGIPAPVHLHAIFSHSEYLYPWQRELIENYWGCRCFDWYAMEERVILGMECEHHHGHHLITDFAITEFMDEGGPTDAPRPMLATSLVNYAMPFIRYETGDVGQLRPAGCPCGRGFPLLQLGGGRKRNYALGRDGSLISITNIDIPAASQRVLQFQFVQHEPGRMRLLIVPRDGFGETDVAAIRSNLATKFGSNMEFEIERVTDVQRTSNNKTPLFIQQLKEVTADEAHH
jgi:phenylacetate-CoA ligase